MLCLVHCSTFYLSLDIVIITTVVASLLCDGKLLCANVVQLSVESNRTMILAFGFGFGFTTI